MVAVGGLGGVWVVGTVWWARHRISLPNVFELNRAGVPLALEACVEMAEECAGCSAVAAAVEVSCSKVRSYGR